MSTSPSLARAASAPAPVRSVVREDNSRRAETQPFPYELIPADARHSASSEPVAEGTGTMAERDIAAASAAVRESQARALGREEGLAEAEKTFADLLVREREGLALALAQFTRDRAAYFQKIEGEVVQLALAIAHKILHREAQMDPLLLAGIVRVAIEKIDGATGVVLRVHPENAGEWRRYLMTHLEAADHPQIVEDASLPRDQCALETSMGTAVVGLEVQMKEIEQGLMDLLAARPGASS
jgi:flagellar biosynthesis/type III secretory pathway protein FliH